ncbi:hypothetical protein M2480_000757 [Parabacteroides sp. PFB2-12]|nr:hypothetical protein [Parabacteroides sp. PM6-13]MDH6389791.1 hypothetical protein [Parabacteroides sp. PFB2-12]
MINYEEEEPSCFIYFKGLKVLKPGAKENLKN